MAKQEINWLLRAVESQKKINKFIDKAAASAKWQISTRTNAAVARIRDR